MTPSGPSLTSRVAGIVLLIEPEGETRNLLSYCLQKEGHQVLEASCRQDALDLCDSCGPTAIVLSDEVFNDDSLSLLQAIRAESRAHIILTSNRTDEFHQLAAFDAGANDYLTRPLRMNELAARLRAAHRFGANLEGTAARTDELSIDPSTHTVKVSNRTVKLTVTEFSLLSLFVRNAGKVLTHAQILREVWGPRMVKKLEYLRVYLKSLREKLETDPDAPRLLLTERSIGYRLALPEA